MTHRMLQALAAMATHTSGPSCFFNFSSGSNGSASSPRQGIASLRQQQQQQPSGIVCSASLGGGMAAGGGGATGSGSAAAFLRLPKHGYSFALWVQLEDGREAAEQLEALLHASHAQPAAAGQAPAAGGSGLAAGHAVAGAASDQSLFALVHQQQASGGQQQPHLLFQHAQQAQQLLSGVALAVRRAEGLDPARSRGRASQDGGHPTQQGRPSLLLVAHCWAPKHAEAALPLQQPLVPGRWHHLAVTHSAGAPHACAPQPAAGRRLARPICRLQE